MDHPGGVRQVLRKLVTRMRIVRRNSAPHGPMRAEGISTGRVVLVADDQRTNRTLLVRLLNMLGYAAEATEDGAAALEKWESGRFALIITDCQMPQIDGYELARRIRSIESQSNLPRTPIMAWAADANAEEIQRLQAAGMDGHLLKPVDLEALAALLKQWLPPPGELFVPTQARPAAGENQDVTLDKSVLALYSNGDMQLEQEILRDFQAMNRTDVAMFEEALARHSTTLVAQSCHRIKGSSRMIGARAFASICERLEQFGRARNWDGIASHREAFFSELRRLNEALNSR